MDLPFNVVLRILDIFLYEGYKIIYRVALSILKIKEKELIAAKDFDNIVVCLKNFKHEKFRDEDLIIKTSLSFRFSRKKIMVKILKIALLFYKFLEIGKTVYRQEH